MSVALGTGVGAAGVAFGTGVGSAGVAGSAGGAAAATDPYWSQVEWMINFDAGIADLKNGRTTTLVNGATREAGGYLQTDGGTAGEHLAISGVSPIGTQDYCFESFIALVEYDWDSGSVTYPYLMATDPIQGADGWLLYIMNTKALYTAGQPAVAGTSNALVGKTKLTIYHVAVTRSGGKVRIYHDGVRVSSGNDDSSGDDANTTHYLGGNPEAAGYDRRPSQRHYASRLTIGTDRGYNGATIVPPTYPFPTS